MSPEEKLLLQEACKSPLAFEENQRGKLSLADDLVDKGWLTETTVYHERRTYEITPLGCSLACAK